MTSKFFFPITRFRYIEFSFKYFTITGVRNKSFVKEVRRGCTVACVVSAREGGWERKSSPCALFFISTTAKRTAGDLHGTIFNKHIIQLLWQASYSN